MVHLSRHAAPTLSLIHEYLIAADEMGDSAPQSELVLSLVAVLRWLYRDAGWYAACAAAFT